MIHLLRQPATNTLDAHIMTTKVSLDFTERQLGALKWISDVRNEKMSESLSRSIETLGFLVDAQQQGRRILIEDKTGKQEILVP